MQLVIEISEADYEYFKNTSFVEHEDCLRQSPEDRRGTMNLFRLVDSVKDGIVLPKGHGRLIDVDEIVKDMNTFQGSFAINIREIGHNILNIKCLAPTVIPADKDGD